MIELFDCMEYRDCDIFPIFIGQLDVVSQGYTIEDSITNLKEAVELYIDEMGLPEELTSEDTIIVHFEVPFHGEITHPVRA